MNRYYLKEDGGDIFFTKNFKLGYVILKVTGFMIDQSNDEKMITLSALGQRGYLYSGEEYGRPNANLLQMAYGAGNHFYVLKTANTDKPVLFIGEGKICYTFDMGRNIFLDVDRIIDRKISHA